MLGVRTRDCSILLIARQTALNPAAARFAAGEAVTIRALHFKAIRPI
jgi:hypothetical protein